MSLPHIYKLTDNRNGSIYIGQTNGKHPNYFTSGEIPLNIIAVHGQEIFTREILVEGNFNQEMLNQLEKHYIRLFVSFKDWGTGGYNLTTGGHSGPVSKETREKLRKANLGKKQPDSFKQKMSLVTKGEKNGMYGRKHTEESKRIMSINSKGILVGEKNPMFGKKHSEEARKKMSEANIGLWEGEKNSMFGKTHTQEVRDKISSVQKKLIKKCEFCEKEMHPITYESHHKGAKCLKRK